MADPTVAVVLTLKDKLSGALKNVTANLVKQLDGVADRFNKIFGTKITGTQLAAGIGIVAGAVTALGTALYKTAQQTMQYALSIGDMSTALGITAEEASTLVQIGDDLRISQGSLTVAFRTLARQGVQPTIENIKELAAQYKAIEDPAKRSQFALENFGRQGLQLTRLLSLTNDEIDEMAQSAQAAGLIMSEEGVQAAKDYYAEIDNLQDQMEGLKITIGNELIPVLSSLAGAFNTAMTKSNQTALASKLLDQAIKEEIFTYGEAEVALADYSSVLSKDLKIWQDAPGAIKYLTKALYEATPAWSDFGDEAKKAAGVMSEGENVIARWDQLLKYGRTETEKIQIATSIWNEQLDESNRLNLEAARAREVNAIASGKLTEEEIAIADAAIAEYDAMLGIMDVMYQTTDAVYGTAESMEELRARSDEAIITTSELLGLVDTSIASPIAAYIEDIKWMLAGGAEITQAFEAVKKAIEAGVVTPEGGVSLLENLYVVAEETAVTIGKQTLQEAIDNIVETLSITPEQAEAMLAELDTAASAIAAEEVTLNVVTEVNGEEWDLSKKPLISDEQLQALQDIKLPTGIGAEAGMPGGGPIMPEDVIDPGVGTALTANLVDPPTQAAAKMDEFKGKTDSIPASAAAAGAALNSGLVTPIVGANSQMDILKGKVDAITAGTHTLDFLITVSGDTWVLDLINMGSSGKYTGPPDTRGPGGQHGLNMIVPPGYPNDTFPIRVSSGEQVTVTPPGQTTAGGPQVVNVTQVFNDEGAAALGMATVRQMARNRLNASMGR